MIRTDKRSGPREFRILHIRVRHCPFALIPPFDAPVLRRELQRCLLQGTSGRVIFMSDNCHVGGFVREFLIGQ